MCKDLILRGPTKDEGRGDIYSYCKKGRRGVYKFGMTKKSFKERIKAQERRNKVKYIR